MFLLPLVAAFPANGDKQTASSRVKRILTAAGIIMMAGKASGDRIAVSMLVLLAIHELVLLLEFRQFRFFLRKFP